MKVDRKNSLFDPNRVFVNEALRTDCSSRTMVLRDGLDFPGGGVPVDDWQLDTCQTSFPISGCRRREEIFARRSALAECPLCAKSRHSALQRRTSLFDHLVSGCE